MSNALKSWPSPFWQVRAPGNWMDHCQQERFFEINLCNRISTAEPAELSCVNVAFKPAVIKQSVGIVWTSQQVHFASQVIMLGFSIEIKTENTSAVLI